MDMGLLFWFLMILWLLSVVGTWANWSGPWVYGSSVLQWILFGLLGWKVFGPILK
jgi:hypothetical protein